jgi:bifunctional DNA-binding transcriptional regulator/antitoxin component of YhaV-PrlF toxin-antitoxin module
MLTVVSTKGQIVLPAEFRKEDRILPGQQFSMERLEAGVYVLKKIAPAPNEGFVRWLQSCPEPDWFQNIPSESTDSL